MTRQATVAGRDTAGDVIRRLAFQRTLKRRECDHLDGVSEAPAVGSICSDCEAEGTRTVHLRMCMTCGRVACCDSSRPTHARRHHEESGHPLIRSVEPGESWIWCYLDRAYMAGS